MRLWRFAKQPEFWLQRRAFLTALILAAGFHVLILFGIHFKPDQPAHNRLVSFSITHSTSKPGDTERQTPEVLPVKNQAMAQKRSAPTKLAPTPKSIQKTPPVINSERPSTSTLISAESLQQQISQLGEQIRNQQPATSQKVKYATTVSNHRYLAAQYVQDWENKVEHMGNLNYPEAARHKKEAQILTMDVGINPDGSIYSLRITRSSGNPELDEAAKRIVRMSAPFAALPTELLQEVNVLIITRVWKFSDETGMTSH